MDYKKVLEHQIEILENAHNDIAQKSKYQIAYIKKQVQLAEEIRKLVDTLHTVKIYEGEF